MAEQMATVALGLRRVAQLKRGGIAAWLGLGEGSAMRAMTFMRWGSVARTATKRTQSGGGLLAQMEFGMTPT